MMEKKSNSGLHAGKGTPTGEELVKKLPGEEKVDEDQVKAAVAEVNRIHTAKGLEAVRDMGRYLLDTFFDGDHRQFRQKGKKHASFRRLAKEEGLRVSPSTLWNSVAIVLQLEGLPPKIADALPVSHHRLLLPIKDRDEKIELAHAAAGLTKRELADRIKKMRRKKGGGTSQGRPMLPEFYKALKAIDRAAAGLAVVEVESELRAKEIEEFVFSDTGLKSEKLTEVLDDAEKSVEKLQVAIKAGRAVVAAHEAGQKGEESKECQAPPPRDRPRATN